MMYRLYCFGMRAGAYVSSLAMFGTMAVLLGRLTENMARPWWQIGLSASVVGCAAGLTAAWDWMND